MKDLSTSRRGFLAGSAAAIAAISLAACGSDNGPSTDTGKKDAGGGAGKGSSADPLPKPAKFQESPLVAAQVQSGDLPPIEKRLPENPYVIPHKWVQPGKYGGKLKMNVSGTDIGQSGTIGEWFYGSSLLRFLNDGQDIGPGLLEKWQNNADATEWTLTMRKGVKWSDGKELTTDDILFWWNDMANYDPYTLETPPDECKSGKGTICTIKATDEYTFTMSFDAPAPLTADRLAMWTSGYGGNGPTWVVPAHYAKNFHPKYNKSTPDNWTDEGGSWMKNMNWRASTKVPVLIPYKLKKVQEGRAIEFERNPYYYGVMPNGDQLPYVDGILFKAVSDPKVGKVQIAAGQVDFSHGPFNGIVLADFQQLKQQSDKAEMDVMFWDSGTGAAGIFFLNYDYAEDEQRKLFRDKRFRQALSIAFNRDIAKKSVYFEQGEATTGTMSPKAMEFLVNDEGKTVYKSWRDSAVKYDPEKANALLDDLGMKKGSDGFRTLPNGDKFVLRIDYPADTNEEYKSVDALKVRDWKAVGINARQNPVPPTSFDDNWKSGKYMGHSAWEVGDGPNCLLYPQWMVPLEYTRWAPLEGEMYNSKGTKAYTEFESDNPWKRQPPRIMPEKDGPVAKLWDLYDQTKVEPDEMKRTQLVWDIIKVHVSDGPFFQGTVANPPQVISKKKTLKNVPTKENLALGGFVNPWIHPTPAVYDPDTYFWDDPEKHDFQ
jgi:peptide/nickel transport system substrate-binding protein